MARTNLSLGNLYRATQGSARTSQAVSLNAMNASAGTAASMLAFAVDSITINQPTFTYIVESTEEAATFSFGSAGALHGTRIGSVAANYSVTFNNANFTVGTATLGASPSFPITPASIAAANYSEASSVLSMTYADGYNTAATNYNTTSTKTLYAVDVYNTINQPDFCLLFGTKVTLANGNEINVEDLNVGDEIKAWVPAGLPDENLDGTDTGETEWRFWYKDEVSGTAQNVIISDLTFNFASGYYSINNGLIKTTGTHPLYVFDNEIQKYKFKNVENILIGDKLVMESDVEVEVTNIEQVTSDVEIVTINVEESDVYLANGVVSHNKGTTTQSSIPASGLKMYIEPAKTASFASSTLPSTGTPSVDVLDMSGYGTGVRPGAQSPLSLAGGNPSYNNGASRKERYYAFDGGDLFYKDTASNINGGISQFNTNTGTIHVWVRPTTTLGTTTRHIFDYGGFFGLAIESSNSSTLDRVKFYGSTLGNSAQLTTSLSANVWYMISATFQPSGTVTVYVDGTSVGTFTAAAFTAPASTNYLTIGANSARTTFWNGQIGPVLFYSVLQDATAVTRTYSYFSPNYK
jgi:hypothetical protein